MQVEFPNSHGHSCRANRAVGIGAAERTAAKHESGAKSLNAYVPTLHETAHVIGRMAMAKPKMTSSATLRNRVVAFGVLFGGFAPFFDPLTAVLLALVSAVILAKP